ncbi:MAG: hydantoinase/oxoprolinase family protein [Gammaproteobacteria bacterium]|nr:hydantoinase/oxoprolinase family protein [Gammaproteobacteria bacterium]
MSISAQTAAPHREFILALDAGGTMTDTILVLADGSFKVGKSLTNRADEPASYLESVADAAAALGLSSSEAHSRTAVSIYAGTGMLNTLLTGTGRRAGLLVTRGFEDITIIEGGLTYLGQAQHDMLHNQLHEHTRPMMDSRNVRGISERTCVGSYFMDKHLPPGEILFPVNERQVREAVRELLAAGIEILGILFTGAFVNPANEAQAKAVAIAAIAEAGAAIPVVCSHEVAPVLKENNRMKSLLLQITAAEHTRSALQAVERAARRDGYDGQLLTLLSYGGAVNVSYPRLYETVISGPIGGLMAGQILSRRLGIQKLLCSDMGGTSFDVGLVVDHQIPIRKDPDFAGHRLALPMVALDSVGAGAGSAVWLDKYKRLHVGPESAGAAVGCCYEYDKLTVTDVNVVMGYVDPDYFLGGKVRLDRARASAALEEQIARPLGLDLYAAGAGILEVINTNMRETVQTMMLAKGYEPSEFTVLCYGGAGPVHMWGYTEGLGVADVITVPYAAAFSAFGAACAEYMHRYHRGLVIAIPNEAGADDKRRIGAEIDAAFRALEDNARRELAEEGADLAGLHFDYGIYARYIGQLESFDTPLDFGQTREPGDVDRLVAAFEDTYTKIYPAGARFPEVGYAISEVYVKATVPKAMPVMRRHTLVCAKPADSAYVGSRRVCHRGELHEFGVWQMGELAAGNVVAGPAIIRDPMTTVVVPPGKRIEIDEYEVLHYR